MRHVGWVTNWHDGFGLEWQGQKYRTSVRSAINLMSFNAIVGLEHDDWRMGAGRCGQDWRYDEVWFEVGKTPPIDILTAPYEGCKALLKREVDRIMAVPDNATMNRYMLEAM